MPKLAASVTMLFNEWPLLDRFAQAAAAGFQGVEVQDPYGASKDSIAERVRANGLKPVLMNTAPAVAAVPGREAEFRAGIERAFAYAAASGCGQLHCLAGVTDAPSAEATFVANLRWAAATAPPGMRILIEPLNTRDNPGYFLTGSAQARRILEQVEADNVFLQFDFYHMQIMEGDLAATVRAHIDAIAHFQVGGVPGRHEPDGAQEINYPYLFDLLDDLGFRGWVGCEYRPAAGTLEGLSWARRYGITPDAGHRGRGSAP